MLLDMNIVVECLEDIIGSDKQPQGQEQNEPLTAKQDVEINEGYFSSSPFRANDDNDEVDEDIIKLFRQDHTQIEQQSSSGTQLVTSFDKLQSSPDFTTADEPLPIVDVKILPRQDTTEDAPTSSSDSIDNEPLPVDTSNEDEQLRFVVDAKILEVQPLQPRQVLKRRRSVSESDLQDFLLKSKKRRPSDVCSTSKNSLQSEEATKVTPPDSNNDYCTVLASLNESMKRSAQSRTEMIRQGKSIFETEHQGKSHLLSFLSGTRGTLTSGLEQSRSMLRTHLLEAHE